MYTTLYSASLFGLTPHTVSVEVDIARGLMQFMIVGLPDAAVRESKQRIAAALKNSGFAIPDRKITINLAPADLKKEGTLFDLPIALALLQASQYLKVSSTVLDKILFIGELALSGELKPVKGVLPITQHAATMGFESIIVPAENATEASLVSSINVHGARTIQDVILHLQKSKVLERVTHRYTPEQSSIEKSKDFKDVHGQVVAKRAMAIAAAGGHNILFIGPPGAGKTMLAERFSSLLKPLNLSEAIQTQSIYSAAGRKRGDTELFIRPFCAPHHTISYAGLVGGGTSPQPGEISMAHNGVLFLDEIVEFKRSALETLRQPLETGTVSIARAQYNVSFPARFQLIAACNPCPCGFTGHPTRECGCSPLMVQKYMSKLSGPLLDRIDIHCTLLPVTSQELQGKTSENISTQDLQKLVNSAIAFQQEHRPDVVLPAYFGISEIEHYCHKTPEAEVIIQKAMDTLGLSARAYHKIIKVARTLADIDQSSMIEKKHIIEALNLRIRTA